MTRLRQLLLGVVALGVLGLSADLVLTEHWDSILQWVPFAVLLAAFPLVVAVAFRPTRSRVRALQVVLSLFVVAGLVGIWLHWRGNALLQLEMEPSLGGWSFVERTVFGGVPVLAPGSLLHMGLVGLLATFRHPTTVS